VLKTAKLRGVYSQGLALPIQIGDTKYVTQEQMDAPASTLAEVFEVIKYEPPLPTGMNAKGPFPTHLGRKTDAERVQNLTDEWDKIQAGTWTATEKIDGTSVSVFMDSEGEIHVCSRNWELEEGNDLYWRTVKASGILDHLSVDMSIRGEIFGEGVQGNPLGMKGTHLAVFDYTDVGLSLPRKNWPEFELVAPVLDLELPATIEEAVEQVNGMKSAISPERQAEGVVWWGASFDHYFDRIRTNFKAINNKYLLKHGG
jgi:RNA ligase (TIGR02306 family)